MNGIESAETKDVLLQTLFQFLRQNYLLPQPTPLCTVNLTRQLATTSPEIE